MLKMKKIKIFKNMTIAKRVTLLYGSMFSITIIIISAILWSNASNISQSIVKNELDEAVSDIKQYISENDTLTDEGMEEVLKNKSVFATVTDITDMVKKFEMPSFMVKDLDDNVQQTSNFPENDYIKNSSAVPKEPAKRNDDFKMIYIGDTEYMLLNDEYMDNGRNYRIDVFTENIDDRKYMTVLTIKLIAMDFFWNTYCFSSCKIYKQCNA